MRIAIVNDLALAREVLRRVVHSIPGHRVAWMAEDGEDAVRHTATDRPDAILMDLVMPRLDGAEATRRIMKATPCPILVVTSTVSGHFDLVYRAMGAGALDAVETPVLGSDGSVIRAERLIDRLSRLEVMLSGVNGLEFRPVLQTTAASIELPRMVAIGASTGGPDALNEVLAAFPANFPAAVLIAQHIGAEYAEGLCERLALRCKLPVRPAKDGEVPLPGVVSLAATNDHLALGPQLRLRYTAEPLSTPYRPSVDVLFQSLAAYSPRQGVAVLLTGMGTDGAAGLGKLRDRGWHTIAQDEATCVVYGMPRAAVELKAAREVLPLSLIGPSVAERLRVNK